MDRKRAAGDHNRALVTEAPNSVRGRPQQGLVPAPSLVKESEEDGMKTREMVRETMAYLLEQSPDIDVWMSHSRRLKSKELNSRTFLLRLLIILIGLASLLIDIVAIIVSVTTAKGFTLQVAARTSAIAAAFLVTVVSNVVGGGGGSLQIFVLLTTACLLLDASMMALVGGSNILFVIGMVATIFRLASIFIGIRGVRRDSRVALTEQLYLHLVDDDFAEEMLSFELAVQQRLGVQGASPAEEHSETDEGGVARQLSIDIDAIENGDRGDGDENEAEQYAARGPSVVVSAKKETAIRKDILYAMVQHMEDLYEEYRDVFETTTQSHRRRSSIEMCGNGSSGVLQLVRPPDYLGGGGGGGSSPHASGGSSSDVGLVRAAIKEKSASSRKASSDGAFRRGGEEDGGKRAGSNNADAKNETLIVAGSSIAAQPETFNWLRLVRFREAMHSSDRFFTNLVICLLFILFALTAGNVIFEFWKIFANQPSLFPDEDGGKFLNRDFVRRTCFPYREKTGLKVHVVVVDGLRDDFTEDGASAIADFLNEPSFRADSLKISARAQLPSFSVPNWMTILSGSPPEDSGVTGNLQNAETRYDTLYGIAKAYSIHAGMTGTPWWADLVASSLPPLGGDGTISTSERPPGVAPYEWTSGDLADDMRGVVAVQAAIRSTVPNPFGSADPSVTTMYELFLTHFSDVDMQGHDYGIDTKWNKRDTYRGAVANKTRLIRKIVEAVDNKTVVIITSDHGHVLRGGHGGEDSVLRDVPVVFYKRGSGAESARRSPVNFLPTEEPRSRFETKYSNLDFPATITALLGLPSPRQSLGVLVEEAIDVFTPANSTMRLRFYHDLFLAKISLVKQYKALLDDTFFSSAVPVVLKGDPMVEFFAAGYDKDEDSVAFDTLIRNNSGSSPYSSLTEREYADAIRIVLADYWTLRERRFAIVFWRNFALSVCVAVPSLIILITAYMHSPFVRITSILHPRHPNFAANLQQCLGALLTITIYVFLSIITYVVIYYGVVGQRQWDPTAVHTPSVAGRYVASVIVAPIIYFTIVTKAWLYYCNCLHWRLPEVAAEYKALKKKFNSYFISRWISHHAPRDLATVLFVTREFKPSEFLKAHLYTQYLAFFVALTSLVLLFLCFPFTFFLPIVFNVSHVSEFNIVYRFRVITVMFMMIPMQVGVILMLALRPSSSSAANARMWDAAFLEGRLNGDAYEMGTAVAKGVLFEIEQKELTAAVRSRMNLSPNTSPLATSARTQAKGKEGGATQVPHEESLLIKAATRLEHEHAAKRYAFILELKRLIRNPTYRTDPLAAAVGASAHAGVLNVYSNPASPNMCTNANTANAAGGHGRSSPASASGQRAKATTFNSSAQRAGFNNNNSKAATNSQIKRRVSYSASFTGSDINEQQQPRAVATTTLHIIRPSENPVGLGAGNTSVESTPTTVTAASIVGGLTTADLYHNSTSTSFEQPKGEAIAFASSSLPHQADDLGV